MTTYDCSSSEILSALFDGQTGAEIILENLPPAPKSDLYRDWNCYQLIGEAIRGVSPVNSSSFEGEWGADPSFLYRFSTRLRQEIEEKPLILPLSPALGTVAAPIVMAANDRQYRWKVIAGFASVGAIAVLAWGLTGISLDSSTSQLAQSQAGLTLVIASPEGPMVRDARLEELLSAHKQLGATSFQVPPGFVRNAGFESPRQSGR